MSSNEHRRSMIERRGQSSEPARCAGIDELPHRRMRHAVVNTGHHGVAGLPSGGGAGRGPVRGGAAPAHHRAGPRPVSARAFWPPAEAAQADYEMLRAHLLKAGVLPGGLAASRFTRRGLAGLIAWPAAEPVFRADLR